MNVCLFMNKNEYYFSLFFLNSSKQQRVEFVFLLEANRFVIADDP
jgi:hypothetical protein